MFTAPYFLLLPQFIFKKKKKRKKMNLLTVFNDYIFTPNSEV